MNPMVEFCISNLANGAQAAFEKLERDPNIDVLEAGCTSFCTKCANTLFAVVEGELVEADTPDELLAKIYEVIDNNPIWAL